MITKKDIQYYKETRRIILSQNEYVYLLPHPALREEISNYTVTFPGIGIISDRYTVIPHGCATLVFGRDREGIRATLFGPMTEPCMVGGLANQCSMLLIIEFQPAGLSAFTGMEQKELTNRRIPFEQIDSKLSRLLAEILESAACLEELIDRLDYCLLANRCAALPPELQMAANMLIQSSGSLSCKELSACVHYSERHLGRIFQNYFGMNAKTFSRLIRINKAIRILQNPRYNFTRASCGAGFYDQPHFIHEFQSLCGMTPQQYRSRMSDFYNEIAKF